jgi:ankyrin repeat protein
MLMLVSMSFSYSCFDLAYGGGLKSLITSVTDIIWNGSSSRYEQCEEYKAEIAREKAEEEARLNAILAEQQAEIEAREKAKQEVKQQKINSKLQLAASKGNINQVKFLVNEMGADIHANNDFAFQVAIKTFEKKYVKELEHFEVVEFLFSKGADINVINNISNIPFKAVTFLFQLSVISENFSKAENFCRVKFLVEKGADIHRNNDYAFKEAIKTKHFDIVNFLIEQGCNIFNPDIDLGLWWIYQVNNYEINKLVNDYNFKQAYLNSLKDTVKVILPEIKKVKTIQSVQKTNEIDTISIDTNKDTASIKQEAKDTIKNSEQKVNNNINITYKNDLALREAALKGNLNMVKSLIEEGADIHAGNDRALKWAAMAGHLDVVKLLVEEGANIHAESNAALRWAENKGHLDVVEYLKSLE